MLQLLLEHGDFLHIDILRGSVATYLRCSGVFKYTFVANLQLSLSVKEFRKLVNIWGSYGQEFSVLFFDSQCKSKEKYTDIAVRSQTCLTATGTHTPYRITQCYLPPDRGNLPAFTPAEAGTRFSDLGGFKAELT